jgi:hypothetical protein
MTIPDEAVPLILKALEFYVAYLKTGNRDDRPYLEVIAVLKGEKPKREK